jgi:hypothetical protein
MLHDGLLLIAAGKEYCMHDNDIIVSLMVKQPTGN